MKSYRSHSKCWKLGVLLQMSPGSSCSSCMMKGGLLACFCRHHLSASSLDIRTQSNLTSFWHIARNLVLPNKEMHKHHTGCLTSHSYHVFSWFSCQWSAQILHSADHGMTGIKFASLEVTTTDDEKGCLDSSGFRYYYPVLHVQCLNRNLLQRFNKHCQAVLQEHGFL